MKNIVYNIFQSVCNINNLLFVSVASKKASKSEAIYPSLTELVSNILSEKSNEPKESSDRETVIYDKNGVTHVLPWTYNPVFDSYGENLPPSLKRVKVEDFSNVKIVEWG